MTMTKDVLKEAIWANFLDISHSGLLERLGNVTQMVTFPNNQMTRTRLSHTQDVFWLAETVSEGLDMFTRLCMTIAIGHDIGHVPFGHDGERIVRKYLREDFTHGWMGVRLLKIMGFSIQEWVAIGIEGHSDGDLRLNKVIEYPEGRGRQRFCDLVAILDDVANAASDPFDVIMEYTESNNPEMREIAKKARALIKRVKKEMGIQAKNMEDAHQKILAAFTQNIIENSYGKQGIFMSKKYLRIFKEMKRFVYEEFHSSQYILDLRSECTERLEKVMEETERIIVEKDFKSPIGIEIERFLKYVNYQEKENVKQQVVDFICTRTDHQIFQYYKTLGKTI